MNISMGDICSIERSNTPQRFGGPLSDLVLFHNPGTPRADPLTGTARSRNFGSRAGADHQPCRPMRCMRTQPVTATEPVAHSGSREDPRQGRLRERDVFFDALRRGASGKTTEESTMRTYLIVLAMTCAAFFGAVEYSKPVKDQPMVIIGYVDE